VATRRSAPNTDRACGPGGVRRLILAGVILHRPSELAWIARAVPGADFTLVRLVASEQTILERVRRRELGSGLESQLERTKAQLRSFEDDMTTEVHLVATDGQLVADIAAEIVALASWTGP
jgi:hypothetical protein